MSNAGNFQTVELYAKDNKGNIRVWSAEAENFTIKYSHGVLGGQLQITTEHIPYGKGGRDAEEQMLLQIKAKIKNKIDTGYVYSVDEAREEKRTNAMGFMRPMLAQIYQPRHVSGFENFIAQRKLNGYRCLTQRTDEIVSYTKKGRFINSIQHIQNNLSFLPKGFIVDGELYRHGYKFQTISSLVKKGQAESENIEYHIYDLIDPRNLPYSERMEEIKKHFSDLEHIKIVENHNIENENHMYDLYNQFVDEKYEGLMLRNLNSHYQDGKRTRDLLKVKSQKGKRHAIEEEFLVLDLFESPKGVPMVWCVFHDGKKFKVVAPGSAIEKEIALMEKEKYINKFLTVGYTELTEDGKPFQPIGMKWRDLSYD